MKRIKHILIFIAAAAIAVLLSACVAALPTGPSIMVLPPQGKPFPQFQAEDAQCRLWARQSIGMSPQETVNQNAVSGAAVGTAVGAGIGAVIGAASGHAAQGAAIGAGSGLLIGSAEGAEAGRVYGWEAQRRYDIAYQQCMYSLGNIIPSTSTYSHRVRRAYPPPPPPGYYYLPSNDDMPAAAPGTGSALEVPLSSAPTISTPPPDFRGVPPDFKETAP